MIALCHRCDGDLSLDPGTTFCPHCGAPQLLLASTIAEGTADEGGSAPPPRASAIAWQPALQAAVLVTGGAMLLLGASAALPALSLAFLLWVGSASLLTLELYRHNHRQGRVNAAIGARIGASVGVLLMAGLGTALAAAAVLARFGLHRMSHFDAELRQRMTEQIDAALVSNPAAAGLADPQRMPELIAGSVLLGLGLAGAFVFAVSVAGGALGGLLRERQSS